jgi:hypothetical protein
MFEDEMDDKIYNILITRGEDKENEYGQFTEKLYSKVDFLWKETMIGTEDYDNAPPIFFENIDVIILLAGLYVKNKEKIDKLVNVALKYKIPMILVRPYGMEEVPLNLEKVSDGLVGWNANCIVDTIKGVLNPELNQDYCELD